MAEPQTPSPSDLHRALGISLGHASNILSGARAPSRRLAIRIWQATGLKTGPLVNLSDAEARQLIKIEARVSSDIQDAAA